MHAFFSILFLIKHSKVYLFPSLLHVSFIFHSSYLHLTFYNILHVYFGSCLLCITHYLSLMNEGSCLVCSTSSPQLLDLNLNEYILRLQFIEDETEEHSKQLVHDHSLVKEQTHI